MEKKATTEDVRRALSEALQRLDEVEPEAGISDLDAVVSGLLQSLPSEQEIAERRDRSRRARLQAEALERRIDAVWTASTHVVSAVRTELPHPPFEPDRVQEVQRAINAAAPALQALVEEWQKLVETFEDWAKIVRSADSSPPQ